MSYRSDRLCTVCYDQHLCGQGNINFPCSADHDQDWQPYPVDPHSCYMCDHTYIQSQSMDQNAARGQLNREKLYFFPVPIRALEFGLARRAQPSRPTPAGSFSTLRLNLVVTHGVPPAFRDGVIVHLFI